MVPLSYFSTEIPLEIGFVPNRAVRISLSIPEHDIQTNTIIGSTVPFLSLIEIFGNRFALPHKEWKISVNGTNAERYHMIHDFHGEDVPLITLSS
jgi:hypothetical protein